MNDKIVHRTVREITVRHLKNRWMIDNNLHVIDNHVLEIERTE
jgi:hypothetical protein